MFLLDGLPNPPSSNLRNRHIIKERIKPIRRSARPIPIRLPIDHHLQLRRTRGRKRHSGSDLSEIVSGTAWVIFQRAVGRVLARLLRGHKDGVAEVDGDGGVVDDAVGTATHVGGKGVVARGAEGEVLNQGGGTSHAASVEAPDNPARKGSGVRVSDFNYSI